MSTNIRNLQDKDGNIFYPLTDVHGLVNGGNRDITSALTEFDVSASGATFANLTAALNAVPSAYRKGGLTVKWVRTSDNKYVHNFNTSSAWTVTESAWVGMTDGAWDVTKNNGGATFESLQVLLSDANLNTLIPSYARHGGMTIRFVQTSDNKYVQYRLMSDSFNTTPANWEGVDDVPTAGSKNLVKSGGIENSVIAAKSILQYELLQNYQFAIAGTVRRDFHAGEEYYIENLSNSAYITVSTRLTPDGTSSDIIHVAPNEKVKWTVTTDSKYLRCGQSGAEFNLYGAESNYNLLNERIDETKEKHQKQTIYNLTVFAETGISAALNNDEYGYSTYSHNLYYKDANGNVSQIPLSKNSLYSYNDKLYKYDGTGLSIVIEQYKKDRLINISVFDRGKISERLQSGEYGYNTQQNLIVQVKDGVTVSQKPEKDVLYRYIDTYYYSDGDKLIESIHIDDTVTFNSPTTVPAGKTFRFPVEKGVKYIIEVDSDTAVSIFGRETEGGSNVVTISSEMHRGFMYYEEKDWDDINWIRIWFNSSGCVTITKTSAIKPKLNRIYAHPVNNIPPVKFDTINDSMIDTSDMFSKIHYTQDGYTADIMEQIYRLFDELVALHPNYVRKYDPMVGSGTTQQIITIDGVDYTINVYPMSAVYEEMSSRGFTDYPVYCNGISEQGQYLPTPAYKTYLYEFRETTNTVIRNIRKNVLLIAGVHGTEKIPPFDLYMLANELCNSTTPNMYKLRGAYNFFMVPEINGYGSYHTLRTNADGVNINRNFPTDGWDDADSGQGTGNYKGPYAGSEFETRLIISLTKYVKPALFIDHHNTGYDASNQFEVLSVTHQNISYRCCLDTIKELCTNLPTYFGHEFMIPNPIIQEPVLVSATRWAYEKGYNSATVEVCQDINFNAGQLITDPSQKESFTNNVVKISEYAFRHYLTCYLDWIASYEYIY